MRALSLLAVGLGLALSACSPADPGPGGGSSPGGLRLLPTNAAAVDFLVDLVGVEAIVGLPNTALEFTCAPLDPDTFGPERTFGVFSAEVLLAFAPDVVVVSPWQHQDTIQRLESAGVVVAVLPVIEDLDDVRRGLLELGELLGVEPRAAELIADLDARVAALVERTEARRAAHGELRAISYTNYGSGGWAAGAATTADVVLGLAGLTNAVAATGRSGHDSIDLEGILTLDPDLFVVSRASETYGVTRAYLEGEPALAGLRSLRDGAIVEVPANLYSTTSHYLVEAAEALVDGVEGLDPGH